MRPAEGEVVVGDLLIAVQVPPNVPARRYTIEAGYWDPARNDWAYPGTLGHEFSGGTTATTRIAADMRMTSKLSGGDAGFEKLQGIGDEAWLGAMAPMRVFSKGKVGIEIDRASRPVSMLVLILV